MPLGTSDDRAQGGQSKSSQGAASTGGRGRDGYGASSASSKTSSNDAAKGGRVGSGGFGGTTSRESTGGRGRDGVSASTASSPSKGDRVGSGSYSSRSSESTGGRGRDGFGASTASRSTSGMGDRVGTGSFGASAESTGGRGRGGFSAAGNMGTATGFGSAGYSSMQEAQRSMLSQGVRSVGGLMTAAGATQRDMALGAQHRQSENQSMADMAAFGQEVVGVVDAGKGWTTVEQRDGTITTRRGTRASRNNNPGNIEFGKFAKSKGAVGTDGRFAVFGTAEEGKRAMGDLVFGSAYAGKTVGQAIGKYAPPSENNTTHYANTVAKAAGVSVNTPLSDMTENQRSAMVDSMISVEGGRPFSSNTEVAGNWGPTEQYAGMKTTAPTSRQGMVADNVPTPTARPSFTEKYLRTASTEKTPAKAPTKRSTAKTIAGLGVDIGVGMIPGIGMAAGVVNAGLSLAGKPTIGQMMVDTMGNPVHIGEDATGYASAGGSTGGGKTKTQDALTAAATTPVDEFGSKYLGWSDPTKRPTPKEKYGASDYGSKEYG